MYQLLADAVGIVHASVALTVVLMLPLTLIGGWRGWRWVRAPWVRIAHLAGIAVIAAQSWIGVLCPLTTLEAWLRARAGADAYAGGFVEHWLHRLLYYDAPAWVFTLAYTGFALLVLVAWILVPPRSRARAQGHDR